VRTRYLPYVDWQDVASVGSSALKWIQ
jgi:hypothetical protein